MELPKFPEKTSWRIVVRTWKRPPGAGYFGRSFRKWTGNETGYYELDEELNLVAKYDPETNTFIKEKFAIPENVVEIEESSVLVIDDKNRRWRLPLGEMSTNN